MFLAHFIFDIFYMFAFFSFLVSVTLVLIFFFYCSSWSGTNGVVVCSSFPWWNLVYFGSIWCPWWKIQVTCFGSPCCSEMYGPKYLRGIGKRCDSSYGHESWPSSLRVRPVS